MQNASGNEISPQSRESRPPLSAVNITKRLEWCTANPTFAPHRAILDEKWWHAFRSKKKVYRRFTSPPVFHHPPAHVLKAMFLTGISCCCCCSYNVALRKREERREKEEGRRRKEKQERKSHWSREWRGHRQLSLAVLVSRRYELKDVAAQEK